MGDFSDFPGSNYSRAWRSGKGPQSAADDKELEVSQVTHILTSLAWYRRKEIDRS